MSSFNMMLKNIENYFHSLVTDLKPALNYLESKGGEAMLQLAESVLAGFASGAPWATIVAALIPEAKAAGVTLLETDASIILNLAKANLDAKNAVVTPAAVF